MLDIYREVANPKTGEFDYEALNNYETELQGLAREHLQEGPQLGDEVETYMGQTYVNGVLVNADSFNEEAEMDRELMEATVKDREHEGRRG